MQLSKNIFLKIFSRSSKIYSKFYYIFFIFLFGLTITKAYAAKIYESMMPTGAQMAINVFGPNMLMAAVGESAMKVACGGETSIDMIYTERTERCLPIFNDNSNVRASQLLKKGIMPGGLAYYTASLAGGIVQDPVVPTNMALFLDETFKDNVFGIKPSYAQSGSLFGVSELSKPRDMVFASITFDLWKQTRNLALAMTGVLLAIGAMGIMFRQKLSPQVVVTIGNLLPQVPIALLAIVLSYPIVTVFLNLVDPLSNVARDMAYTVAEPLISTVRENVWAALGVTVASVLNPYTLIAGIIAGFAGGFWVGTAVVSFFLFFVSITLVFLTLATIIRFIIEIIQVFITYVIVTVAFPIVAAFSILPGRQSSLLFLFKKLLANVLVIPIMWFTLIVGLAIMITAFAPPTPNSTGSTFDAIALFFGGGLIIPLLKFSLGTVFIWSGLGARKHLENALGAGGSVLSSVMPSAPQQKR